MYVTQTLRRSAGRTGHLSATSQFTMPGVTVSIRERQPVSPPATGSARLSTPPVRRGDALDRLAGPHRVIGGCRLGRSHRGGWGGGETNGQGQGAQQRDQ